MKCRIKGCESEFTSEERRNLHEQVDAHCSHCGKDLEEELTNQTLHKICDWCTAESLPGSNYDA